MLGSQELEDEAHILQNVGRVSVDALPRFDLGDARGDQFGDGNDFLHPSCVCRRGRTHHFLDALVRLELHQADAARGAGGDGRVGAERGDKRPGSAGGFKDG